MRGFALAIALIAGSAGMALAELKKLNTNAEFLSFVQGKTLTRPLIKLTVSNDGRIAGKGMSWPVEGNWRWQDGYFCRDLFWGGDNLGYNCQEVRASGNRIRFTSDKGSGQSAEFRLN